METFKIFILKEKLHEKKKIILIHSLIPNEVHVNVHHSFTLKCIRVFFFFYVWLSTFVEGIIQDWNLIYEHLLAASAVRTPYGCVEANPGP